MNRADRVEPASENANFIRGCDHPAVKIGSLETTSAAYRLCAARSGRPDPQLDFAKADVRTQSGPGPRTSEGCVRANPFGGMKLNRNLDRKRSMNHVITQREPLQANVAPGPLLPFPQPNSEKATYRIHPGDRFAAASVIRTCANASNQRLRNFTSEISRSRRGPY